MLAAAEGLVLSDSFDEGLELVTDFASNSPGPARAVPVGAFPRSAAGSAAASITISTVLHRCGSTTVTIQFAG